MDTNRLVPQKPYLFEQHKVNESSFELELKRAIGNHKPWIGVLDSLAQFEVMGLQLANHLEDLATAPLLINFSHLLLNLNGSIEAHTLGDKSALLEPVINLEDYTLSCMRKLETALLKPRPTWVHIDLDILDLAGPNSSPLGASPKDFYRLYLSVISRVRLVAVTIMSYSHEDPHNQASLMADHLIEGALNYGISES